MNIKRPFHFPKNIQSLIGGSCLLYIVSLPLFAQDVTTSTNIFIPTGIDVTTSGSFSNSGNVMNDGTLTLTGDWLNTVTGFLMNNGKITLTGDWLNTFTYQGSGAIFLTGTAQTINNNNQAVGELFIEGGGIKTLEGTLPIKTLLTFNRGILKINDLDTLRLLEDATIAGGSSQSYADGAVNAIGTKDKFFPIGKFGKYHPIELLDITGINPEIAVEVEEDLGTITTSIPATPIQDIYWTRKTISGTFEGSRVIVYYDLRDAIESDHVVILEGNSFSEEFITRQTNFQRTNDLDKIESLNSLTGTVLALGELIDDPPRQYYFSTTLSPNATNPENRTVKIFGDNVTTAEFRFQVFNRWGLPVFESTSATNMANQGWDGRQNGNMLATGVYPYSLTYIDSSRKVVRQTGFITIIQ